MIRKNNHIYIYIEATK